MFINSFNMKITYPSLFRGSVSLISHFRWIL